MRAGLFTLVVVDRGPKGQATLGFEGVETTRFEIKPDRKVQIRFEKGRFNLWVNPPEAEGNGYSEEYEFSLSLAHAQIASLSEAAVEVTGVEVREFFMTGHAVRVILTADGAGY